MEKGGAFTSLPLRVYRELSQQRKFLLAEAPDFVKSSMPQRIWRGGRVVYGFSLEN
jgi:hypothetical protein